MRVSKTAESKRKLPDFLGEHDLLGLRRSEFERGGLARYDLFAIALLDRLGRWRERGYW